MRTYPTLTEQATSRDFIESFGGYNHNIRIGENEFYDMKNLSSSNYPVLSTRPRRGTYRNYGDFALTPVGFINKDGLWVLEVSKEPMNTDGDNSSGDGEGATVTEYEYRLQIREPNQHRYSLGLTNYDGSHKRNLIFFGTYIVIFPDKKYINTDKLPAYQPEETLTDASDWVRDIEVDFTSDGDTITYELCKANGTAYNPDTKAKKEPTDVESGHLWLDTSSKPYSLKIYSSANKMWTPVASTYIKISCSGIGANFRRGDAVRISGVTPEACETLNFAEEENAASIIQKKDDDYIVVVGMINDENGEVSVEQKEDSIEVRRVMPTMDFIFENNNRLWGCRYGDNRDGETVNEIYASKLNDFKNWEYFAGTSQDSYALSLGASGEFTGAISYLGMPLFFRQNCIHTISGGFPAQYRLQTTECRGVQQGCHNSLTMIDGTLYYKAMGGVCAYKGSLPMEIGSALGEEGRRYHGAYGGAYRHKYYLGMRDALEEGDTTWLYVYDTEKGMWHKEDEYNGQEFCYSDSSETDQLYYLIPLPQADGGEFYDIKNIMGEGELVDTDSIDWFAETGVIGCSSPDKKYISRMSLRLSTKIGARVYVFAEYDSSGTWEQIGAITSPSLKTFTFPIRPKRCDHFRLRIAGTDEAKIYSISKTLEQGSDI